MSANAEVEPVEKAWRELSALIDSLGTDGLERKGDGQWAVKDHLAHIAVWDLSLLALLDGADMRKAMGVSATAADVDAINEEVWLAHRHDTAAQALAFSRDSHEKLMRRLGAMSDADLRRSYNHYQPNDPRDPNDDRPVVEWVAGDTYDHYAEHMRYIQDIKDSSASR